MRERQTSIPELLSPAADMQCLIAAAENGCDAVYIGGKNYSARRGATNFTREELHRAIEYCHLRGIKTYVAINTLYKQDELDDLYEFIEDIYTAGADAFITADFGVSKRIIKIFRDIEIHASTQMSVSTYDGASFMQTNGFSRVVLAREMPLEDVRRITSGLKISTEIFVHGSLCYSYSGQCFMSSMIGGRSGNRGQCAQPCRLKYTMAREGKQLADGNLLSMRDLCTLPILREIVESGVTCLKIEGRQKSAQYVAAATRAYRHALDAIAKGKDDDKHAAEDKERLARVFCRGGKFTQGYLKPGSTSDLMCEATPKHLGPIVGRITKASRSSKPNGVGTYVFNTTEELVPGDGIETFDIYGESVGSAVNSGVAAGGSFEFKLDAAVDVGAPVYKSYDKAVMDSLVKTFNRSKRKLTIYADVSAKLGENLVFSLSLGDICVFAEGGSVQPSKSAPVSREVILEKLSKTGDTPFRIEFVYVDIDDDIFVPVSQLNNLRRMLCETFTEVFLNSHRREPAFGAYAFSYGAIGDNSASQEGRTPPDKLLTVYTYEAEQLDAALTVPGVARYYCEARPTLLQNLDSYTSRAHSVGAQFFVALPEAGDDSAVRRIVEQVEASAADGYLITNWGHFTAVGESPKLCTAGSFLNALNHATWLELHDMASTVTLSSELMLDEAYTFADSSCEIIVHGHLMSYITKMCPVGRRDGHRVGDSASCGVRGKALSFEDNYVLIDRKGLKLPVLRSCEHCYTIILYGQCLSMLDRLSDLDRLRAGYLRLLFTTEPPDVVASVTVAYAGAMADRRAGKPGRPSFDSIVKRHYAENFTHGNFDRGIT
ncbi:MAG: U32 family peptidase [Defluviitaleaceae bacterium]|nr:U32 family peptidase [Defluviitaleaceae bacterium]